MTDKILVTGALGQIGTELTVALRKIYGLSNVITSDIKPVENLELLNGPHEILNVTDIKTLLDILKKNQITQVYHLAAILSANGERNPIASWNINMSGLLNILEAAVTLKIRKVFWPSSIAVFGPATPKWNTPQHTTAEPTTVYGISKLAGEGWCNYYFQKEKLDVRSLRYPGLISYKSKPGGGTTDYAVEIFHEAKTHKKYSCFLKPETTLPMMYMPDALRATIELMHAESKDIHIRTAYNIAGVSFNPQELAQEIKNHIPDFEIFYEPDFRQEIAASWPASINDLQANLDWSWKAQYNLEQMTADMLKHV